MQAAALLLFACTLASIPANVVSASSTHPKRWIIASNAASGSIMYAPLPRGGGLRKGTEMKILLNVSNIPTLSLTQPMGIAVDQLHDRLFFTDPVAKQIVSVKLDYNNDAGYLSWSDYALWVDKVESKWVAVDGAGNLYLTNEANNQIMVMTVAQHMAGNHTPEVLYGSETSTAVSGPAGIGVDSFRVYWVNKKSGTSAGSVVRAPKRVYAGLTLDDRNALIEPLADNSDKSYGLCMAMSNIFYTQPDNKLYGIPSSGQGAGNAVTISDHLVNPRGCTFDNDGTVYVADRGANAIYSFAGNQQILGAAEVAKTVDMPDAFDVAVFSSARPARCASHLLGLVLLAVSATSLWSSWF